MMEFRKRLEAALEGHAGIHPNLERRDLIDHAIRHKEAIASACGALATWTPPDSTGRSPKDTLTVRRSPQGPEETLPALRFEGTEVFLNQQHVPGRNKTVLFGSHCVDPDSGKAIFQPDTGWLEPAGAGQVLYFQPGHRAEDFRSPAYRQILLNCLLWQP